MNPNDDNDNNEIFKFISLLFVIINEDFGIECSNLLVLWISLSDDLISIDFDSIVVFIIDSFNDNGSDDISEHISQSESSK
ncbi:hypothetical protein DERP_008322 [Dermatophagoides pteronyssinus]|uniref:Uncharacterized protein n=1 Tax=Dermatophagoides pteronyssinus TaxID=6956 RepID=A0ABQ8J6M9_DERPT|nr:hypothetical protein DERP_008322 [Dermatophagoides pteronyssinus]